MDFTYKDYINLINLLKNKNYQFTNYKNYSNVDKPVILRHDIDNSIEKALEVAKIESNNDVNSTFFVLLSTEFYNIFSLKSYELLKEIINCGHTIGLHFDEKRYVINNKEELEHYVEYEKNVIENALGTNVDVVSMHRPSKWILENDIRFKNAINSYSENFLQEFKYLSDSRMYWRENVLRIIENEEYNKLHILTHPFWYDENAGDIKERVSGFIKEANRDRYCQMKDNIRDIGEIVSEEEIV